MAMSYLARYDISSLPLERMQHTVISGVLLDHTVISGLPLHTVVSSLPLDIVDMPYLVYGISSIPLHMPCLVYCYIIYYVYSHI